MSDLYPVSPVPAPEKRANPWLTLAIVLGVVVLVLGAAAAFLIIDPLKTNLVGTLGVLLGIGGDPVVAAVPDDAAMYFGMDLLNATPDKINRIYTPFANAADSTKGTADVSADLDKDLQEAYGMTVKDDITPWLGRYAGVSLSDLSMNAKTGATSVEGVLAIQSRDNAKADAFLQKLKSAIEKENDVKFVETSYSSVTIYNVPSLGKSKSNNDGIAFARSGNVVMFSLTPSAIQSAMDAQKANSLAKDKAYQDLIRQLPKERVLTMYLSSSKLMELYSGLIKSLPASSLPPNYETAMNEALGKTNGVAISYQIVDAGIQIDGVGSYNPDKLAAYEKAMYKNVGAPVQSLSMVPEDALFFIAGQCSKEYWTSLRDLLIKTGSVTAAEYDEAMSQAKKQINVNPDTDLFPYLGGDLVMAGFPSSQGALKASGVPLGLSLLIGTSDSQKMMATVDNFSLAIQTQAKVPAARKESGDLKYYTFQDTSSKSDLFALGTGKQYLAASTSSTDLEKLFSGQTSITKAPRYQAAVKALPAETAPGFYLDLENTLAAIRSSLPKSSQASFDSSVKPIKPVTGMIAGYMKSQDNLTRFSMVILIASEK